MIGIIITFVAVVTTIFLILVLTNNGMGEDLDGWLGLGERLARLALPRQVGRTHAAVRQAVIARASPNLPRSHHYYNDDQPTESTW